MERRLVAILAADMVGYSRLVEADEEGTIARQRAHRSELIEPVVAKYGGRIVNTAGDGVLIEFPSVVAAVKSAVEIQRAMSEREADVPQDRRICYRIGINLGDIVIDGDDILGDGVNVAARLEGLAEPGGICIPRKVMHEVRTKMDVGFEFTGEQRVKNIETPVSVYRILLEEKHAGKIIGDRRPRRSFWPWAMLAAGIAVVAVVGTMAWMPWVPEIEPASLDRMSHPLPEKPSIAVLPFNNFSADAAQDYFAAGITEDLITDLSKLSGLFVISRNSTWAYKDQSVKPQKVAEDLGVRYLLEGSVRRQGDQVRINAQLIDALNGSHVWAERYDGNMGDVFGLQDTIVAQITSALAISLTQAEQTKIGEPETTSILAYDAVLKGFDYLRTDTEDGTNQAISLFDKALDLDPEYGRAYAGLAAAYWRFVVSGWTATAGYAWEQKLTLFESKLDDSLKHPTYLAHSVAAQYLVLQGKYDDAFVEVERAMALGPNEADTHVSKAKILNAIGRAEEAEKAVRWAMRLDPKFSSEYQRVLAVSLFNQGRYADARDAMERVVNLGSENPEDYSTLAAALGHLGKRDEAKPLIDQYNTLATAYYLEPYSVQEAGWWWYGDLYGYYAPYRDALQEGLRKAGVPEGAGTELAPDDYLKLVSKENGEFRVSGATMIDVPQAKELFERGDVAFVDVRAPSEFALGHIPGAVNLSAVSALSKDSLFSVCAEGDPVAFYCHGKHCMLSAYAAAKAIVWGYRDVYYFAEGFPGWESAGLSIEADNK